MKYRKLILVAFVLSIVAIQFGGQAQPTSQVIDYQKVAEGAEWAWDEQAANPFGCMFNDKYTTRLTKHPKSDGIVISVLDGEKELYEWTGHGATVFRIADDRLFYAKFTPLGSGGEIVAVDLKTGTELWRSKLRAVPARGIWFNYGNSLNLDVQTVVIIYGSENAGRYVEFKDLATGETVGHKVFN